MIIRQLRTGDIPEAVSISRTQLGSDYLYDRDFLDAMDDPSQFCTAVEEDGRLAGFAICKVFGPEDEGEVLKLPDCPERDIVMSVGRMGILDSVAVSPEFAGKGIGKAMCRASVETIIDAGCGLVCAMAWKDSAGHTNIAKILRSMGFEESIELKGYWNGMVDSPGGHDCPICGAPCKCSGVFWYRRL